MRHGTRGWWTAALAAGALVAGATAHAQSMVDVTAAMGTQSAATAAGGTSPVQTLGTVRRGLNAATASGRSEWAEASHGGGAKDAWAHGGAPSRTAANSAKGWVTAGSPGGPKAAATAWARKTDTTVRPR